MCIWIRTRLVVWWLLPLGVVFGYAMAWVGRFRYERNRPASWHSTKHFTWSFMGDWKMIVLMLSGRLGSELDRVQNTE